MATRKLPVLQMFAGAAVIFLVVSWLLIHRDEPSNYLNDAVVVAGVIVAAATFRAALRQVR